VAISMLYSDKPYNLLKEQNIMQVSAIGHKYDMPLINACCTRFMLQWIPSFKNSIHANKYELIFPDKPSIFDAMQFVKRGYGDPDQVQKVQAAVEQRAVSEGEGGDGDGMHRYRQLIRSLVRAIME